jgi:hypothetical protein
MRQILPATTALLAAFIVAAAPQEPDRRLNAQDGSWKTYAAEDPARAFHAYC